LNIWIRWKHLPNFFRIDFPGQELIPETSHDFDVTKLSKASSEDASILDTSSDKEKQAVPEPLLNNAEREPEIPQQIQEVVSITTRNQEEFDCSIPKLKPENLKVKIIKQYQVVDMS
jgi:hypothetical protein